MAVKISGRVFFYLGPGQTPRNGGITFLTFQKTPPRSITAAHFLSTAGLPDLSWYNIPKRG
jgi:hypothetical protein